MNKQKTWCPNCRKNSVFVVGLEPRKFDGLTKRKAICITEDCTYSKDLDPQVPYVKDLKKRAGIVQGQVEFKF